MRIAIDARMVRAGKMHGIARYVQQLLFCFKEFHEATRNFEFFVIVNAGSELARMDWPQHMRFIHARAPWISLSEQAELTYLLLRHRIELFHATSFVAPFFCPARMVMTIHDLNHLVLPQFYTPVHTLYYDVFVRRCAQNANKVLTVSQFAKQELMQHFCLPSEQVVVTYNGVSAHYGPRLDPDHRRLIRELYGLPEHFIFCLSNNKPHKNIERFVRAWARSSVSLPLVIAASNAGPLIAIAEDHNKKHMLFLTRYIDEKHLPTVYSMTRLFVFPSIYEGFGLPPLEALACGAQVLVANVASLPEVVGRVGGLMDPFDENAMMQALEKALSLEDEPHARVLRREHAQGFSWRAMAEKTLEVYASVGCVDVISSQILSKSMHV